MVLPLGMGLGFTWGLGFRFSEGALGSGNRGRNSYPCMIPSGSSLQAYHVDGETLSLSPKTKPQAFITPLTSPNIEPQTLNPKP